MYLCAAAYKGPRPSEVTQKTDNKLIRLILWSLSNKSFSLADVWRIQSLLVGLSHFGMYSLILVPSALAQSTEGTTEYYRLLVAHGHNSRVTRSLCDEMNNVDGCTSIHEPWYSVHSEYRYENFATDFSSFMCDTRSTYQDITDKSIGTTWQWRNDALLDNGSGAILRPAP